MRSFIPSWCAAIMLLAALLPAQPNMAQEALPATGNEPGRGVAVSFEAPPSRLHADCRLVAEDSVELTVTNGNYDTAYLGGQYKEHREAYVVFDCLELTAGDKAVWNFGKRDQKADEFDDCQFLSQDGFDPLTNTCNFTIPQGRSPETKLFPKGLYTRHFRDCKGMNAVSRIVLEWEDSAGDRKLAIHTYNYADDNHLKDDIRVLLPTGGEKRLQIPDGWGKAPVDLNLEVAFQTRAGTNRLVLEIDALSLVENLRAKVQLPDGWSGATVQESGSGIAIPSETKDGKLAFTLPSFERSVGVTIMRGDKTLPLAVAVRFPRAGIVLQGVVPVVPHVTAEFAEMEFLVDGRPAGCDREPPFRCEWNTCLAESGNHTLSLRVTDKAGKRRDSPTVTVQVVNRIKDVFSAIGDLERRGHELTPARACLLAVMPEVERVLSPDTPPTDVRRTLPNLREPFRRAIGNLIALDLPRWAHDLRWAEPQLKDLEKEPLRDIMFLGRSWGGWCGLAAPNPDACKTVADWHKKGYRVGAYFEGCLAPITFAMFPPECTDTAALNYARGYTAPLGKPNGEQFGGLSGGSPKWRAHVLDQMELLARMGADLLDLDSAFGSYFEAGRVLLRDHPRAVFSANTSVGDVSIDDPVIKFRQTHQLDWTTNTLPDWDGFHQKLRDAAKRAYNIPIWSVVYVWSTLYHKHPETRPDIGFYMDLAYATSLADKAPYVEEHEGPSEKYKAFARRFSEYLTSASVSVYADPNSVSAPKAPPNLRVIVNRRVLERGGSELVVHLLNVKPRADLADVEVCVDAKLAGIPPEAEVTLASPETGSQALEAKRQGDVLSFRVPRLSVWAMAVVGRPLFPHIGISSARTECVPGTEFEVELAAEPLDPRGLQYDADLSLLPAGWEIVKRSKPEEKIRRYTVRVPLEATKGRYVLMPYVDQAGARTTGKPLELLVTDAIDLRLDPVAVPSAGRKPFVLTVHATSRTDRPLTGKLTLVAPEGWKAGDMAKDLRLDPRGEASVSFEVGPVPPMGLSLWDCKDVPIPANWACGGDKGQAALKLRCFAPSVRVFPEDPMSVYLPYRPEPFPNRVFGKGGPREATEALKDGRAVLWLTPGNYDGFKPGTAAFLTAGGGVLAFGAGAGQKWSPVEQTGEKEHTKLKLLEHPLCSPIAGWRSEYEGRFIAQTIRPKPGARILAVWEDGSPAIVASADEPWRVVYVGAEIRGDYAFDGREKNLWYLAVLWHRLLEWASGGLGKL